MESLLVNLINKIAGELPWAHTVDEDYGQLEALDDENIDMYPLTFPAVLIDLPGTTTIRMPAVKQQTELCNARKKEKPCTHCCRVIG